MFWEVPKIWQDGDVWIIGGGYSIIDQFNIPEDVVDDVMSMRKPVSVYSPFMESIHNKHIIGTNIAYQLGNWIDWNLFGDDDFIKDHLAGFNEFKGLVVTCAENYDDMPSYVHILKRDRQKHIGINLNPKRLSFNNNTGSAAVNLAILAGAKRIFLLGFDMVLKEKRKYQHWHAEYRKEKVNIEYAEEELRTARSCMDKHLRSFPVIAKEAAKLGVEIYNVNPNSLITDFPKITLKTALKLAKNVRVNRLANWAARRLQYKPNILEPNSFNEKVLHKKLFDRDKRIPLTTDKITVRDFVIDKLKTDEHLVDLLWIGEDVNVPFETFPDNYIIKPSNSSGRYIIVRDGEANEWEITESVKTWLEQTWGQDREEWGYSELKPKILVEPLLMNSDGSLAWDYKFHMFNGKCHMFYVDVDRDKAIKRSCYELPWKRLNITVTGRPMGRDFPRPDNFDEMLQIAEKLSEGFDFVRIDLYNVNGKIYFGEMTHYPASGSGVIEPVEYDYELGKKWKIKLKYQNHFEK